MIVQFFLKNTLFFGDTQRKGEINGKQPLEAVKIKKSPLKRTILGDRSGVSQLLGAANQYTRTAQLRRYSRKTSPTNTMSSFGLCEPNAQKQSKVSNVAGDREQ